MKELFDLLPTAIVLFCGGGGSSLGLHFAGFREVLSIDNWLVAQRNFENNFREDKFGYVPFWNTDIMKLTGEDILKKALLLPTELALCLITAPCQGFSISGKGDVLDPRNACFLHSIKIAFYIKSNVIVWENVPGMIMPKMTPLMNQITRDFQNLLPDYKVYCFKVNALYFGCPTDRERLFFIAIRLDVFKRRPFLKPVTTDILQYTIANTTPGVKLIHFGQSKRVIRFANSFWPTVTATEGIYYFENGVWVRLADNEEYLKRVCTFPEEYAFVEDETAANKHAIVGNGVPPMLMYHLASYIRTQILGYPPMPLPLKKVALAA